MGSPPKTSPRVTRWLLPNEAVDTVRYGELPASAWCAIEAKRLGGTVKVRPTGYGKGRIAVFKSAVA